MTLFALITLWSAPGLASTVVVELDAESGPLQAEVVEATVWHALWDVHHHDAVFVQDASRADWPSDVGLHITVSWTGASPVSRPRVTVRSDRRVDGVIIEGPQRYVEGRPSFVATDDGWLMMPDASLRAAVREAVDAVPPPVWGAQDELVSVPVVVMVDAGTRARHGGAWQEVTLRRVARANALLAPAGLQIDPVVIEAWGARTDGNDLAGALARLGSEPQSAVGLRVGVVAGDGVLPEHLGRASQPGDELVVLDVPPPPGRDAAWSDADVSVALAHEVLHALGVPHDVEDGGLMAAHQWGLSLMVSPGAAALARAAATVRCAHWDTATAATTLEVAASRWIADPDVQLDYIAYNLAYGPGFPKPYVIEPDRLGPMSNAALSRHYLQAATRTGDADLRESAAWYAHAALAAHPSGSQATVLTALLASTAAPDEPLPVFGAGEPGIPGPAGFYVEP